MTDLKITSIGYSRLVNLGNYENEKIHAQGLVEEGQDPMAVLASLKEWVNQQLKLADELNNLEEVAMGLRLRIQNYERRLARMKQKWEEAVKLLAAHGITIDDGGIFADYYADETDYGQDIESTSGRGIENGRL